MPIVKILEKVAHDTIWSHYTTVVYNKILDTAKQLVW